MTRRFGSQPLWAKDRRNEQRNFSLPNRFTGGSLPSMQTPSLPGLHQGRVLPLPVPRLLPLPANTLRGRSFGGSLIPSQPQVGGILGQHWHYGVPPEQKTGQWRFFTLGILSHSTTSYLRCKNLLSFLPMPWGLPRLKHFKEKWTEYCRRVLWTADHLDLDY